MIQRSRSQFASIAFRNRHPAVSCFIKGANAAGLDVVDPAMQPQRFLRERDSDRRVGLEMLQLQHHILFKQHPHLGVGLEVTTNRFDNIDRTLRIAEPFAHVRQVGQPGPVHRALHCAAFGMAADYDMRDLQGTDREFD